MDSTIKFGTSGWRAVIGEEFTFDHVALVTQAIADYVKRRYGARRPKVVMGYDTRFLSQEFAGHAAVVLAQNGIEVLHTDRDAPTPVLGFQILHQKAQGGVNITASHNPPEYNGIKFSEEHGGPAGPEVTRQIEQAIQEVLRRRRVPRLSEHQVARRLHQNHGIRFFDPRPTYLAHVRRLVRGDLLKKAKLRVAVDGMYGTVRGYLDELLRGFGCEVVMLHDRVNPSFGGRAPNPTPEHLAELIDTMKLERCHLALATDCDGDRFAVVDRDGRVMPANEMIALYLRHLIQTRPQRHAVARSLSTTHLVDAMAKAHGMEVIETPVGFKYLGPHVTSGDCLMVAEESGGMSIAGHLPEKDGILAGLLACEIASASRATLTQQFAAIQRQYGPRYAMSINIPMAPGVRAQVLAKLERFHPMAIGTLKVARTIRLDGFKYELADGGWVLIRPSGTEPLLRFQCETPSQAKLKALKAAATKFIEALERA